MKHITLTPSFAKPPTRDHTKFPDSLPKATTTKHHPTLASTDNENPTTSGNTENGSLFFIGTATTILQWSGIRILTDPNFLHAGDHVHLGPGVTAERLTNPAIDLHELPRIDVVLLSHYHADHFDEKVENSLRRDLPIVTTPHAEKSLVGKSKGGVKEEGEAFTEVTGLDVWESAMLDFMGGNQQAGRRAAVKVTGMPGKHVPDGVLGAANSLVGAVPPTNGWMVELGYVNPDHGESTFVNGYRIYISGDTLLVDDLKEIPERYKDQNIDLMLIHLGGTTIPSLKMPLLMVTMDGKQGVKLMQLVKPDVTIPIHFDDYDLFRSPLEDFKKAVDEAGLSEKVVYLDRKDEYKFSVK